MKKLTAIAFTFMLMLTFAACGGNSDTATPPSGGNTPATTQSGDTAATQKSSTPTTDDDTVQLSAKPNDALIGSTTPAPSPSAGTETPPPSSPAVSSTPEAPANSAYSIDHPLFAQAQILSASNGDGYTPFNLQWVDGVNGVISFEVQRLDITSPPDYQGYEIIVFHNGQAIIETVVGGFVGGRTQNPTTTVTEDIGDRSPYTDFGAGEYVFIVYAELKDEVLGQVVKSDVFVSDGSPQTPDMSQITLDPSPTPDTSTPDASPSPEPVGNTIPMPDGFPENPGDAEYFAPITDDYVLHRDMGGQRFYLVSYDEQGTPVQFVAKWVYDVTSDVPTDGYSDEYSGTHFPQGVAVDNVMYIDYLVVDGGVLEGRFSTYGMPLTGTEPGIDREDYYFSKP